MQALKRERAGERGFTLVELMITTALLGVILSAMGMAMFATKGSYERGMTKADVEAQAQRILERIKAEVRSADRSSVALTPAAPFPAGSIDFARAGGLVGGVLQVEPLRQIRMVPMTGEINDGIDNNGNGLIDEQRIELRPDPAGNPGLVVGWGNWVRECLEGELDNGIDDNGNGVVDEPGLWLTYNAATGSLTIQVTVERSLPSGVLFTSTKRSVVQLRND